MSLNPAAKQYRVSVLLAMQLHPSTQIMHPTVLIWNLQFLKSNLEVASFNISYSYCSELA